MLNVAIIGIGNISLLFDTNKHIKRSLSHIKAIYLHELFTLKYAFDINKENDNLLKSFFPNVNIESDYKTLLNKSDVDIVVISTPTNTHYDILNTLCVNSTIKMFFMEKPLFNLLNEYQNINPLIENKIFVNYLRRFDLSMQKLKSSIKNKQLINPDKIIINYCKGLKNNGSHMIDLINFLFENPNIIESNILSSSDGFSCTDKNYDVHLKIQYNNEPINVYFISHNHENYNLISFEIYFENKLVKYNNSTSDLKYYNIINDKNFPSYKVFDSKPYIDKVDNLNMFYNAYEHLSNIIIHKEKNISSLNDELKNIQFLNKMIDKD